MIELTDQEKTYLDQIRRDLAVAEKEQQAYQPTWNKCHGLYHNYNDWRQSVQSEMPRDADIGLAQAKRDWGAQLFIPLTYGLIETIVPRLVASDPRMTVKPIKPGAEEHVEAVKVLLEKQQQQMKFRLKLQDVGKSGLMYGLGVMKTYWRNESRDLKRVKPATLPTPGNEYVAGAPEPTLIYDDPDCQAVDIWDFFWDPFGYDMETIRYALHRTWRSTDYCLSMAAAGKWRQDLTREDLEDKSGRNKYSEAWADRLKRQGQTSRTLDGGDIHEVLEYHNVNGKVCTVLNREIPVQEGANPNWHGELPFQVYRPNNNLHQFVGKGEIEPTEDIQDEMNTMRSQRRDNATFVLQRSFAYTEGLVDPADLKVGPGIGIPVQGDPRELLFPLPMQDIPASSYQEEAALKSDFDYASGISDPVVGASSGDGTATEAQMVFQAASERIKLKTKRLSFEVVQPACRQILSMNQQRILTNREIAIPKPPGSGGDADQRWAWYTIGPEQLAEQTVDPEDGSMIPENIPQERADGMQLWNAFSQSQVVDQRRLTEIVARKFDVDPEALLAPEEPRVPPIMLDLLSEAGVSEPLLEAAFQAATEAEQTGQVPQWPPPGIEQAHEDVATEETQRMIDDTVAQQQPQNGSSGAKPKTATK